MRTLSEISEAKHTAIFRETGSFFAFSDKQLDEAKKENVVYVSLGYGLICPKENAKKLITGLDKIHQESIAEDIAENGAEAIISRELYNHESFYDYDFSRALEALEVYKFSLELILKVINEEKQKVMDSDF